MRGHEEDASRSVSFLLRGELFLLSVLSDTGSGEVLKVDSIQTNENLESIGSSWGTAIVDSIGSEDIN